MYMREQDFLDNAENFYWLIICCGAVWIACEIFSTTPFWDALFILPFAYLLAAIFLGPVVAIATFITYSVAVVAFFIIGKALSFFRARV
jgi:magnesium-transporting ATPase (P-type)